MFCERTRSQELLITVSFLVLACMLINTDTQYEWPERLLFLHYQFSFLSQGFQVETQRLLYPQ